MTSYKALLVIALSSRPFVEAAKEAGYRVVAIDAFADLQTQADAEQVFLVHSDHAGFVAEALLVIIDQLNPADYFGFVFGSGFETQPNLLQVIADQIPLLGNAPATISALKSAHFFQALSKLIIPFPRIYNPSEINDLTPQTRQKIIDKSYGGCGGTHIQWLCTGSAQESASDRYLQALITGTSVSLLFMAHPETVEAPGKIEVIGFNEQWCNPTASLPFRYGGAVSHFELPSNVRQSLIESAEKISLEFGLIGLNSLDVIVHDEEVFVLEVNPRLSATFDLYPDKAQHMLRHIKVCKSDMLCETTFTSTADEVVEEVSKAHAIVYSEGNLKIARDFVWPEWATDIPCSISSERFIPHEAPVCTVFAKASDSTAAKQLAQSRVKILLESLIAHSKHRIMQHA